MADSRDIPKTTSCNTLYPIYLKDKHPSLNELSETPMTRVACVIDFDNACSLEINVKIRKCEKEVQYYLKSTLIFSAYCFGAGEIIYDMDVPPPKNVNLGSIEAFPELQFRERPWGQNKVLYRPYIRFRCAFSNSSDHFYNVQWKVAGKPVASLGPSKNMDDLCLNEDEFKDVPLGYMVQCSVSVSTEKRGHQTLPQYSNKYFAGVKFHTEPVYLKKGGRAQISISSTLPIGCKHLQIPPRICFAELRLINVKPHKCFDETIFNRKSNVQDSGSKKCADEIELLYKGAKWDPGKLYNFTIISSDIDYEDVTEFHLKLQFNTIVGNEFWSQKLLPSVRVFVTDAEKHKEKICYSRNDPHMHTPDGKTYKLQEEGDFTLYHNYQYNIEVQITTKICGDRYGSCICGVFIRAGKDVVTVSKCGKTNIIGFTQCGDGGILQIVANNNDEYYVFTPIGTKITINFLKTRLDGFMSIHIRMAPKDVNNIHGLCGNFDGDSTNDFVHRNGTKLSVEIFKTIWRVPGNKLLRRRIDLESWESQNGLFCYCDKGKTGTNTSPGALCSSTQYLECQMKKSITVDKCRIHKNRKKRSLAAHEKEMDRLFALMEPIKGHDIKKRQANENNIAEEQARRTCSKMINESLAFTSYTNLTASENPITVISQCVFDIMATNDMSIVNAHVDSINTVVKGIMSEVPTYVATNKQEVQTFLKNSCSSNCSDRGICSEDGECLCNQYYHGAICDIDERIPPIVSDVEGGGVCDIGEGDECRCFYLRGDNFLKSMKCRIITSEISFSGKITNVTIETVDGGFEDIFTGVCCIPEENSFSKDMFLREHDISISSDGVHYGENNTMFVFDSTCQKLDSISTDKPSFALKNGFCFIKQACIEDTYAFLSNNDTCLSCNTSVSINDWTETSMEVCIPTTTTSTTTTTKAAKVTRSCTSTLATVPESTTQSIIRRIKETPFPKVADLTTESTMNHSTQTQPQTRSTKASSNKRCKAKGLLLLKQRKNRLSLRNKKRKLKIQRLTKHIDRLKIVLERFHSKGKQGTE